MTKTILAVSFFFISSFVLSQELHVSGTIKSTTGELIIGIGIYQNDTLRAISNDKGYYSFNTTSKDSIFVSVKYFGSKLLTKLIVPEHNKHDYYLNFIVSKQIDLPEMQISAKGLFAFEQNSWAIMDFIVIDSIIVVLTTENSYSCLYVFSTNGIIKTKKKLSSNYGKIIESCMGGLHLIGEKKCREFTIQNNSVRFISEYSKEKYDKILSPCCTVFDSTIIFKEFSNHNKKLLYFYYESKNTKKLYEIIDFDGELFAQSQYNKIIKEYYKSVAFPKKNSIKNGFAQTNIIEDNTWNGDILELMETNELVRMIGFYKNVLTKPLKAHITTIDKKLYIFDFVNLRILQVKIDGSIVKQNSIGIDKCDNPTIILDKIKKKIYLVCNSSKIYELNFDELKFNMKYKIEDTFYFPKSIIISDNYLYFISYDNTKGWYNKLNKTKLK